MNIRKILLIIVVTLIGGIGCSSEKFVSKSNESTFHLLMYRDPNILLSSYLKEVRYKPGKDFVYAEFKVLYKNALDTAYINGDTIFSRAVTLYKWNRSYREIENNQMVELVRRSGAYLHYCKMKGDSLVPKWYEHKNRIPVIFETDKVFTNIPTDTLNFKKIFRMKMGVLSSDRRVVGVVE